jgi:hypothetical protein
MVGNNVRQETRLKPEKQVAVRGLSCGTKTWTLVKGNWGNIGPAETEFFRQVTEHITLVCKHNTGMRKELKIYVTYME